MKSFLAIMIVSMLAVPAVSADQQQVMTVPTGTSAEKSVETATLLAEKPAAEKAGEKRFVAVVEKDGIQRVDMTAGAYYFDPNVVVVKVNVPVELKIKRESGITPHDITLHAPEAGINITEGLSTDPKVIKFTPTKTGKYEFECTKRFLFFKSHKDRGMHGVLEVVE